MCGWILKTHTVIGSWVGSRWLCQVFWCWLICYVMCCTLVSSHINASLIVLIKSIQDSCQKNTCIFSDFKETLAFSVYIRPQKWWWWLSLWASFDFIAIMELAYNDCVKDFSKSLPGLPTCHDEHRIPSEEHKYNSSELVKIEARTALSITVISVKNNRCSVMRKTHCLNTFWFYLYIHLCAYLALNMWVFL